MMTKIESLIKAYWNILRLSIQMKSLGKASLKAYLAIGNFKF